MIKQTKEGYWIIAEDTHIGKWIEENKQLDFDQNMIPKIKPFIKRGDVVLDIGANVGAYSFAFMKFGADVICFEPSDEAFRCLQLNLPNAIHHKRAIGDKNCKVSVVSENDNKGMNYCKEGGEIPMTYIDIFNYQKVNFIKIDVEGHELKVLQGAEKTIKRCKPYLLIEINKHTLPRTNTTANDIYNWLIDNGYGFRNIYQNQGLEDMQFDIICYPI